MFWIILMSAACLPCVRPHPTSCDEDAQCSSGFYCQTRVCVECLRCEELKREARLSPDACVKSATECGGCLKGLVQAYEGALYGQCVPATVDSSGGILPPYGWAAIAVSLVLMVVILCLFAKLKTFKVAFAARTSVQSLQTVPMADSLCAPPPPYHDLHNSSSSQSEALEMQKLVENPHPCESPPPEMRPREHSSSQNAQAFNSPDYVRSPHNGPRYSSPDSTVSVAEEAGSDNIATAASTSAVGSLATPEPTWTIADNNVNTISSECGKVAAKMSSSSKKTRAEHEFQDTNNNFFASQEAAASQRSNGGGAAYCSGVVAGPSFIINVVENINNATMTHEYHT